MHIYLMRNIMGKPWNIIQNDSKSYVQNTRIINT